jgi:hypothetical protein
VQQVTAFPAEELEDILRKSSQLTGLTIVGFEDSTVVQEAEDGNFSQQSLFLQSLTLINVQCSSRSIANMIRSSSNLTDLCLEEVSIYGDELFEVLDRLPLKKLRLWSCPEIQQLESLAILERFSKTAEIEIGDNEKLTLKSLLIMSRYLAIRRAYKLS